MDPNCGRPKTTGAPVPWTGGLVVHTGAPVVHRDTVVVGCVRPDTVGCYGLHGWCSGPGSEVGSSKFSECAMRLQASRQSGQE